METENSVIVQLRVLNKRLRKAENRSLSLMQASRSNLFINGWRGPNRSRKKMVRSYSTQRERERYLAKIKHHYNQRKKILTIHLENHRRWWWFPVLGRTKARTPTQPQKNIGNWDPGSLIKCWQQCFWQPQDCCFIALKSSQIFPVLDQDWYRLKEKILKICTWYPWVIEVGDYKSNLIKKTSVCNLFDLHYYTHLTVWIEQTSWVCCLTNRPKF